MNYQELAKEIHANAVEKGFWDEELSSSHYLMLAICELAEAIEADRKGRRAKLAPELEILGDQEFKLIFEREVKDTVEDEIADCAIRLLDIVGHKEMDISQVDIDESDPFDPGETLAAMAYSVAFNLTCPYGSDDENIIDAIGVICGIAKHLGFHLDKHIRFKMRYNKLRPKRHGKRY